MRRELARRLEAVETFDDPSASLEQYRTPAELAAHVIHLASLHGDLSDRTVIDLGTGTGMLALGAAFADPAVVVALDVDPAALDRGRDNERRLSPPVTVEWIRGDATRPPFDAGGTTVVMNPPFGAQKPNLHADRAFLSTAAGIGSVSYSVHNAGSRGFVEGYADDNGGEVTHAFAADFPVSRQFDFHREDSHTIDVEVYRIEWPEDLDQ